MGSWTPIPQTICIALNMEVVEFSNPCNDQLSQEFHPPELDHATKAVCFMTIRAYDEQY